MLSSEMYLNWNLVLQVTLLKKRRIDAKLILTNDLDISRKYSHVIFYKLNTQYGFAIEDGSRQG